jgi:hypothetical protein
MKKLLTTITLFFPALLFAQQKSGDFINEHVHFKFTPTLLVMAGETKNLPPQNSPKPALFATIGGKFSRYASAGFGAGYFQLTAGGERSDVIPLGIDVTVTDFETRKPSPVFTAQWYHTDYSEHYAEGSIYSHRSVDIEGKSMFNLAAGIALPAMKKGKILLTAGFSQLRTKTIVTYSSYPSTPPSPTYAKDHQNVLTIAASLTL